VAQAVLAEVLQLKLVEAAQALGTMAAAAARAVLMPSFLELAAAVVLLTQLQQLLLLRPVVVVARWSVILATLTMPVVQVQAERVALFLPTALLAYQGEWF
jgi:hypothetical protein